MIPVAALTAATDTIPNVNERIAIHADRMHRLTQLSFQNPAMRQWMLPVSYSTLAAQYHNSHQTQAINRQFGDGYSVWSAEADSYIKYKSSTLWGTAAYGNGRQRSIVWNESSDAHLIYPYFTADSIGGDMSMEYYRFSGGYADHTYRWAWGATIAYTAGLYYRNVDPRPRNVTGKLDIAIGAAVRIVRSSYRAGVSVDYRKYKQSCDIEFVNELSDNRIWHLTGMGTHYERFAGNGYSHYYNGTRIGASVDLYPESRHGAVLSASYHRFNFDHILTSLNKLPLQSVTDNQAEAQAGWLVPGTRHDYAATLSLSYHERTGTENIFGDPAGNIYPQIGSMDMYRRTDTRLQLHMLWQWHPSPGTLLAVTPVATYHRSRTTYADPHRHTLLSRLMTGTDVNAERGFGNLWRAGLAATFRHCAPLKSEIDFAFDSATPAGIQEVYTRTFGIESQHSSLFGIQAHASRYISDKFAIALAVAYHRHNYTAGIHANDIDTSVSFIF